MIAIGIGCRKGCCADDIIGLIDATLQVLPQRTTVLGLFSIDEKRSEAGLVKAAERLELPLTFFDRATLDGASDRAETSSARIVATFGLPSIAETAALAGAGPGAILLVARQASKTATCAIAGPPA